MKQHPTTNKINAALPIATLAGSVAAMVCCPLISSAQQTQGKKLNVILIYADDMGRGMLSAYGQKQLTTPNIDRLVNQGTSFSNAYGCMVSAASRAALLTGYHDCRQANNTKWSISGSGQYISANIYSESGDSLVMANLTPVENRIYNNDKKLTGYDWYLPQVFKQAGYVTGEIGKCEYGWTATRRQLKEHGWDYYYGYLDHTRCHGFYPPFLFDNGEVVQIHGNTHNNCAKTGEPETDANFKARWDMTGKKVYCQSLFEEKIKNFIEQNKDTCFFLYHPTTLPHGPVMIPSVNPELEGNPNLTQIEKEYGSMIKLLDDQVGMIMEEVRKAGIADRTIIIFSSDNGHEIYYSQAGRINKVYSDQAGKKFDNVDYKYRADLAGDVFRGTEDFAGLKRTNLEGGIRVPLVFYGPGIPKGKVRTDIVAHYDLLPTFADMLGVNLKVQKSGVSFLPVLQKGKHLSKNRYICFSSYSGWGGGAALVSNDGWKIRRTNKGTTELYNLRTDPEEKDECGARYPSILKSLEATLYKECNNNWQNGFCGY
jgi:arylsulfatase A-like enzyme